MGARGGTRAITMLVVGLLCVSTVAAQSRADAKPTPAGRRVELVQRFVIDASGRTGRVRVEAWIPRDEPGCQRVTDQRFSPEATTFERSGNRYVRFIVRRPRAVTTLAVTTKLELWPADVRTARSRNERDRSLRVEPEAALARYLKPERYIESEHATVRAFASRTNAPDPNARLRALYFAVLDALRPSPYDPGAGGALRALERRTGDCTEYSDLLTAICRAHKIPARVVEGVTTKWSDVPQHAWVEVHLPGVGWAALDPRHGESRRLPFDRLENIYVRLSTQRVDAQLDGYHYFRYDYFGDPVKVTSKIEVR